MRAVAVVATLVGTLALAGCLPGPDTAPAPATPVTDWTVEPPTPGKRLGVMSRCSHGVRVWVVEGGPNTGGAITTNVDGACADTATWPR